MKKQRLFITFEGGEGSGKTTQIKRLAKRLETAGFDFIVTREPGGTDIGEKIRKITHDPDNGEMTGLTEAYLMAAARAQHVAEVIKPALKEKQIVVSDRFVDSSSVYQGYGRNLTPELVETLNELAVDGMIPDITIYLDITPQQGMKRKKDAKGKMDRLDQQKDEFYVRIYRGYRKLIQKDSKRFLVIDAENEPEALEEKIWDAVSEKLGIKK